MAFANYKHWLLQQCPGPGGTSIKCPTGTLGSQFYSIRVGVTVGITVVTVALETVHRYGLSRFMMNRCVQGSGPCASGDSDPMGHLDARHGQAVDFVVFDPRRASLNKLLGTHLFQWTSSLWPARSAIVIADVWKTTPFIALLILACLQAH